MDLVTNKILVGNEPFVQSADEALLLNLLDQFLPLLPQLRKCVDDDSVDHLQEQNVEHKVERNVVHIPAPVMLRIRVHWESHRISHSSPASYRLRDHRRHSQVEGPAVGRLGLIEVVLEIGEGDYCVQIAHNQA